MAFFAAFQSDLEDIFAKYTQSDEENIDEVYLSEFCDQDETSSDDSDTSVTSEDEHGGRDIVDSDECNSDSSGPSPSRGFYEQYKETSLGIDNINSHSNILESVEDVDNLQPEELNFKKRICDATFVVEGCRKSPRLRHKALSNVYKKPVSIVQPIVASSVQSSQKISSPTNKRMLRSAADESDHDFDCGSEFAQAVLSSRNKIALALAGILNDKQLVRDEFAGEEVANKDGRESCLFLSEKSVERKTSDDPNDVLCMEHIAVPVTRNSKSQWDYEGSAVTTSRDSVVTRGPMCSSGGMPRPSIRRRSIQIGPPSLEHEAETLKSPVQFKNKIHHQSGQPRPSVTRRSTPLCHLGSKVRSHKLDINVPEDEPFMSLGSKSLGAKSGHHSSPLAQNSSPTGRPSGSPKYARRRFSQILKVTEDASRSETCVTELSRTKEKREADSKCCDNPREVCRQSKDTGVQNDNNSSSTRNISRHDANFNLNITTAKPDRSGYRGKNACFEATCARPDVCSPSGRRSDKELLQGLRTRAVHHEESVTRQSSRKSVPWTKTCQADQQRDNSPIAAFVRKRTAKESLTVDSSESSPHKRAKRRSSTLTSCNQEAPGCGLLTQHKRTSKRCGGTSSPAKGRNVVKRQLEGFSREAMYLSPIKPTLREPCYVAQQTFSSPCKGGGRCEKSFCFDCS